MSPEIAQRLLAALEDLTLNTTEAMRTGGWVPTPLQQSFWEAMSEAMEAARQAKAAPQVAQPVKQEPVAWQMPETDSIITHAFKSYRGYLADTHSIALYAAPVAQQPLTDEARLLIEDIISAMEYHVEQTRPVHSTTTAIEAAREFLRKASQKGGAA